MLTWEFEEAYRETHPIICGVDEAGRGPLAGPVVAAAVILPDGYIPEGLNDSKKVSPKKREKLFDVIKEHALAYGIGMASPAEIDEINILNAAMLAMRRAIEAMEITPDLALVDGNVVRNFPVKGVAIIGGDAKSPSIAAASILAKVTRDRLCLEMDAEYPAYGFAGHKGYPTKAHMDAVREHGPSPIHRRTFLKFLDQ